MPIESCTAQHCAPHAGGSAEGALDVGSVSQIVVDSGSEIHVVPRSLVEKWIDWAKPTSDVLLKGAGSQQLRSYGKLRLMLEIEMHTITSVFEIADVRRTIFSVGVMEDHGWKIAFGS